MSLPGSSGLYAKPSAEQRRYLSALGQLSAGSNSTGKVIWATLYAQTLPLIYGNAENTDRRSDRRTTLGHPANGERRTRPTENGVQARVYRRRNEKRGFWEVEGSRRHHLQKREEEQEEQGHLTECPESMEGFCLNGGVCSYAPEMASTAGRLKCECPLTHFGQRCQNSQPVEEDLFSDLRRLFGSWSQSETLYRRKKWRRP
ncbi:hypothetical protein Bbelb_385080 [Branchiostoma belcheri]|nr:hypothetical protein Bbelb_385080 [Branchiostoma belcheri]